VKTAHLVPSVPRSGTVTLRRQGRVNFNLFKVRSGEGTGVSANGKRLGGQISQNSW